MRQVLPQLYDVCRSASRRMRYLSARLAAGGGRMSSRVSARLFHVGLWLSEVSSLLPHLQRYVNGAFFSPRSTRVLSVTESLRCFLPRRRRTFAVHLVPAAFHVGGRRFVRRVPGLAILRPGDAVVQTVRLVLHGVRRPRSLQLHSLYISFTFR